MKRSDLQRVILYELSVRNHGPKGRLAEVTADLPRIRDLGVNTIWLMPIFPVGVKRRKRDLGSPYSVRNFRAVRSELGTLDDLRTLVEAAHGLGMKVILDFVPNHCAHDNPVVREHPDWLAKGEDGKPRPPAPDWWDVLQFDFTKPGLRRWMIGNMLFWMREAGIDGYRMDVAWGPPKSFWRDAIKAMRRENPDVLLIAEADGPQYHRWGFDVSYDNRFRTWKWQAANRDKRTARDLVKHMRHVERDYPKGALTLRFTENHDIQRTRHCFPSDSWRAATVLAFTAPGVPMLYAGQEIGLDVGVDMFKRDPVPWTKGIPGALEFHQRLTALRRNETALVRGSFRPVGHNHPDDVIASIRSWKKARLLVVASLCNKRIASLALKGVKIPRGAVDLLTGKPVGKTLEPHGAWLVRL